MNGVLPNGAFCGIVHPHRDAVLWLRSARTLMWELPGGQVERAKTALDACVREVHEETGMVLRPAAVWPVATYVCAERSNRVDLFATRMDWFNIQLSVEHDAQLWQGLGEVPGPCSKRWPLRAMEIRQWAEDPVGWQHRLRQQ